MFPTGIRDQAICFHCDGGLKDWQPEDDPWIEHEKWYKHCGFINSKNAQLQLEKARKKLQVQVLDAFFFVLKCHLKIREIIRHF